MAMTGPPFFPPNLLPELEYFLREDIHNHEGTAMFLPKFLVLVSQLPDFATQFGGVTAKERQLAGEIGHGEQILKRVFGRFFEVIENAGQK